ncbi:DUF4935 domain-containing protein [Streptomyces fradiae]
MLLELYRFTSNARNELINVLDGVKDRLWIPHQVGKEYYGRRVDAIKEHLDLYASVPNALREAESKALQELNKFARRCSIPGDEREKLTQPLEAAFKGVIEDINKRSESFDLDLVKVVTNDPVLAALAGILDGRTGGPFTDQEVEEFKEKFKERVEQGIPPGFEDARKSENGHGDFFVWEQLLREAEKRKSSVIFVTNDEKKDWVHKQAGLVVGPRPELIAEFQGRCGEDFLLVNLALFLKVAKGKLGAAISASTVAQAESADLRRVGGFEEEYVLPRDEYDALIAALTAEYRRVANEARLGKSARGDAGRAHREGGYLIKIIDNLSNGNGADFGENGDVTVTMTPRQWAYVQRIATVASNRDRRINLDSLPGNSFTGRAMRLRRELAFLEREYHQARALEIEAETRLIESRAREEVMEREVAESEFQGARSMAADLQRQIAHVRADLENVQARIEAGRERWRAVDLQAADGDANRDLRYEERGP